MSSGLGGASLERFHLNWMSNVCELWWISLLPPLLIGDNVSAVPTPNQIAGRDVWRVRSVEADQDPLEVDGFLVCSFSSPWLCVNLTL